MLRAAKKVLLAVNKAVDPKTSPQRPAVSYNPLTFVSSVFNAITMSTDERNSRRNEERKLAAAPYEPAPVSTFKDFVSVSPWYIQYPVAVATSVGLEPGPLVGVAFETPSLVIKLLTCNVESQLFCTEHRYSIFTSALIAMLVITSLSVVFKVTQVPVVSTLLSIITFSGLVMFISFGYSPACMPIIPQCFFSSMIADISYFFPTKIMIPQSLLACQHDQTESVPSADCMISCSSKPFQFTDFSANLAWLVCGNSDKICRGMEEILAPESNWYASIFGSGASNLLKSALYRSRTVLASDDKNIIEGFSWCHYLTLYQIIPLAAIVIFAITGIPLIIAFIVRSLVGLVRTALSAYALSHIE